MKNICQKKIFRKFVQVWFVQRASPACKSNNCRSPDRWTNKKPSHCNDLDNQSETSTKHWYCECDVLPYHIVGANCYCDQLMTYFTEVASQNSSIVPTTVLCPFVFVEIRKPWHGWLLSQSLLTMMYYWSLILCIVF